MQELIIPAGLATLAAVLNLPFGYLREKARRFSWQWYLYIHLPIPFIILLRLEAELDWRYIPLMVIGAAAGQFMGGRLRRSGSDNGGAMDTELCQTAILAKGDSHERKSPEPAQDFSG